MEERRLVTDAEAFVRQFVGGACNLSTPHIYISGLAFCRKSSSTYKNYRGRTHGLIDVKGSAMQEWQSAAIGTWLTESEVKSVEFSRDGARIVSGSYDGTIRVWDAQTGDAVA